VGKRGLLSDWHKQALITASPHAARKEDSAGSDNTANGRSAQPAQQQQHQQRQQGQQQQPTWSSRPNLQTNS